jgi:Transposase DDE domain
MFDMDTFLTILYVTADDFSKSHPAAPTRPGPAAALSPSEVITLALFSQWHLFQSERGFYRYALRHLRPAFPTLPDRSQFNRLVRAQHDAIVAFALALGWQVSLPSAGYEVLDSMGLPVRNVKRRGRGHLAGQAALGWCNRVGWFMGLKLLTVVSRVGAITGFGIGPGNCGDHLLAETLLAARWYLLPRLPTAGHTLDGCYIADTGFAGRQVRRRWRDTFGALVITQPEQRRPHRWPKALRRWLAALREIVETVHDRLLEGFRLEHERPHVLRGVQARLAAKVGLHNFCCWLNRQVGRPPLAVADLVDW